MWLEIEYSPTSLFSLKSSQTTSSGGKSLFSPSPYAVKMALLNAIITYGSLEEAKEKFKLITDLNLSFGLPNKLVVNNCMIKINKIKHSSLYTAEDPFQSTVAFREYIYFNDNIKIFINAEKLEEREIKFLKKWFIHINYFGKKGCFFQFISSKIIETIPDKNYIREFNGELSSGILSKMDDFSPKVSFDEANNYSSKKNSLRVSKIYNIPLRQTSSSKTYHAYEAL